MRREVSCEEPAPVLIAPVIADFAALQEEEETPMAEEPATQPPRPTPPRRRSRRAYSRLGRVPPLFGDSLTGDFDVGSAVVDLPLAGGSRVFKIAENNRPLPTDRIYFVYNHFHNALDVQSPMAVIPEESFSIDRYTLGIEKTFGCGCWSAELRLPVTSDFDFAGPGASVEGGHLGDLAVVLKRAAAQHHARSSAESSRHARLRGLPVRRPSSQPSD